MAKLDLSSRVLRDCREIFLKCDEFDTDDRLKAVFITTPELEPFAHRLPLAARSKAERVEQCIGYLHDQHISDGRPVLLLFIGSLFEKYDPQDIRHTHLSELKQEVESCLVPPPLRPEPVKGLLPAELIFRSPKFPLNEPYYALPEREHEIESILDTLRRPRQRPVVMVSGLGGMGKTALAVEVARRCAQSTEQPFEAIVWESAKQEIFAEGGTVQVRDAAIAFPELVDSFGRQLEGQSFTQRPDQEKLESLAAALRARPCLAIVDNLETMTNAEEIVARLQKLIGGNSRVLITSRHVVTTDLFHVPLRGLPESSSITFLREEGQHRNLQEIADADDDILRPIYLVTQGMPLAMKLVVGQIETLGLDDALETLKRGRGDIYSFIFFSSWNRLPDAAKQLLLYLGTTTGVVSRQELEQALETSGDELNETIQQLVRLSLITSQPLMGLKQRGYSIHQLTRYFVVNDLPKFWAEER